MSAVVKVGHFTPSRMLTNYSNQPVNLLGLTKQAKVRWSVTTASPPSQIYCLTVKKTSLSWDGYLAKLDQPLGGNLPASHASSIRLFWSTVLQSYSNLERPKSAVTEGGIEFTWSDHNAHLEVEISADKSFTWYYRLVASTTYTFGEGHVEKPISQDLLNALATFQAPGAV